MAHRGTQYIIEQRKQQDLLTQMRKDALAKEHAAMHFARWEQQTAGKIEQRRVREKVSALNDQAQERLLQRRRRLADLYNSEMEAWTNAIVNDVETLEERKQRIMERAYALRDQREATRRAYVKEQYDRQWRDACDDARLLDSEALVKFISDQRIAQIHEKQQRKQALMEEEQSYLIHWDAQSEELARREREKEEARHRSQQDLQSSLMQQMQEHQHRVDDLRRRNAEEDAQEIAEIRASLRGEEEREAKLKAEARMRGAEVLHFNQQRKDMHKIAMAQQREQDLLLLERALDKERQAIEEEKRKQEASKHAMYEYRSYLEEQLKKDAEDNAWVDEMRRREEEKVHVQREEMLRKREEARERLMAQVDAGRREQLEARRRQREQELREEEAWAAKFIEDAKRGVQEEQEDVHRRKQIALDDAVLLKRQMAERRAAVEREQQEHYLADKRMQKMEEMHKRRLAEQAGRVRMNYPLKSGNW